MCWGRAIRFLYLFCQYFKHWGCVEEADGGEDTAGVGGRLSSIIAAHYAAHYAAHHAVHYAAHYAAEHACGAPHVHENI